MIICDSCGEMYEADMVIGFDKELCVFCGDYNSTRSVDPDDRYVKYDVEDVECD
jgi:hypothetical protein